MDAKEFLQRVEMYDTIIKNKLIEISQWWDLALGITANMDGERVQTSGNPQRMSDAVNKIIDMGKEIDSFVDRLIDTKREVTSVLEQLENPIEYSVLHMRYIQYKSLQEIADYYGKEYDWATTTQGRAFKSVQAILDRGQGHGHW